MAISRGLRDRGHGLKQRHKLIRKWAVYKEWRRQVFERDDYTCQFCKARNGRGKEVFLEADHIIPFAKRPDLILSVANGRTLCRACHRKTKTWGGATRKPHGLVLQLPLEVVIE
jgi:5-methylcytosine-specific restriction endonuclease McrA